MTAEIAILNKSGIVLASDSASTIGGNKVYNTAKKLFTLDASHSIGIMVYGSADFMGIPWEIIIGQYRMSLEDNVFDTLSEYEDSFLNFLETQSYLTVQSLQDGYVASYAHSLITAVFNNSESFVNELLTNNVDISSSILVGVLKEIIVKMRDKFNLSPKIVNINQDEFFDKYKSIFKELLYSISTYDDVSEAIMTDINEFIYHTMVRDSTFLSSTGIVIAGYGKKEIFPGLKSFNLYSFVMNKLKYSVYQEASVGFGPKDVQSTIMPFAQDDVVNTVVQGVDPSISEYLTDQIQSFDDESKDIYNEIIERLSNIQQDYYINPLLNMIALLPVDETSVIAETLLNLTSFKRKYTSSVETVGGPIDVLSITPSEGPVWIKRKHYFDINDNLGYQLRRRKQ